MSKKIIEQYEIIGSVQVINEITVNLLKKTEIKEKKIEKLIESFYERYPIVEMNMNVLIQGSILRRKYNFSFWDSLIVAAALEGKARFLITEDMQDGLEVVNKLKIINPYKIL